MRNEGALVIIGGAEDKDGDCVILNRFIDLCGGENAVLGIVAAASKEQEESCDDYEDVFMRLGCAGVRKFLLRDRDDASDREVLRDLEDVSGVFFTGGDQLRLTTIIGGTEFDETIRRQFSRGMTVGGTSAGASAMSKTMIVSGPDEDTPKKCTLKMAPGLGLLEQGVIDQHFAQRGRIGRLLSVVAQNPTTLGIGIDEDTAIVVRGGQFEVVGSQTVTIIDGMSIKHTNVSDLAPDEVLAISNVTLHMLPDGYGFDMVERRPFL